MKKMAKRFLCLLSGAVLLCGATGMTSSASDTSRTTVSANSRPTYAATTTYNSSSSTRRPDTPASQIAMFLINATSITLNYNECYYLTVVQSSSYKLPKNGVLTYQWYKDRTAINGATSKTYPVSTEGKYYCKVTEKIRKSTFSSGRIQYVINNEYDTNTVTVNAAPFKIATQPKDGALSGGKYTTSVAVKGGTAPYSYEWYKCSGDRSIKDEKVSNAQSLPATSAGKYYCVITDCKGREIISNIITVKNEKLMAVKTTVVKSGSSSYIDYKITGGSGRYSFIGGNGTYNSRSRVYTIKADNYVRNSREGTTIPTPDGLQSDYWIVLNYYAYVNFTVKDADGQTFTVNEKVPVSTIRQHDTNNADYDYNSMYGHEVKESEIKSYRY